MKIEIIKRYKFAKETLEQIYLDNYFKGIKDTNFLFPFNLILMGTYTLFVSILFLLFFPIFMAILPKK